MGPPSPSIPTGSDSPSPVDAEVEPEDDESPDLPAEPAAPEAGSSSAPEDAFPEDLPPDFWDSSPVDPGERPRPPIDTARGPATETAFTAETRSAALESDPRFQLVQSLFPGKIIEWQERTDDHADGADDESGATEESASDALNLESDES